MTVRGRTGLVVLLAAAAGCGPTAQEAGAPVVRDSAGIAIVENGAPAWSGTDAWRLAPEPDVVIGVESGQAEYEFEQIAGVVWLDDGRLMVADGGASQLRVFDTAGRFLTAVGGRGDGPGEYRLINAVGRGPGDTLWVYDFGLRRFTLLDATLTVARTVPVADELSAVAGVGMAPGGGFVVYEYFGGGGRGRLTEGLRRDPIVVARLGADGVLRDTIAVLPGRETAITSEAGRAVMNAPVAAHVQVVALRGDAVLLGDQERWEVRIVDLAGTLRRVIRRADTAAGFSPELVDSLIALRLRDIPAAEQDAARRHFRSLPLPDRRPAYGDILAGWNGGIWVADWAPDGVAPDGWSVLEADGRLLGRVAMPVGFRPLDVGRDRVVGVHRDPLGVERIRIYRLQGVGTPAADGAAGAPR